jgi:hypothetical protein
MAIRVTVSTKAADDMLKRLQRQLPFAKAKALTATARQAASDVNRSMPSVFQHANTFTQNSVGVSAFATKSSPFAIVSIKPLQSRYLWFETFGGVRTPSSNTRVASQALVLPGTGQNPLPSGFLKRLSAQAAAEVARRQQIAAGTKKRRKNASNSGVFKMSGKGPVGGPGGFFRRLPDHHLLRLVSFEASAQYTPKFDFYGAVNTSVKRNLKANLERALAQALATAR